MNLRFLLPFFGAASFLFSACMAAPEGSTPTPDGAPGFCCPVSTGGCAATGGYSVDGVDGCYVACDGMCNQRIVAGVHGCPTLRYSQCSLAESHGEAGTSEASTRGDARDARGDEEAIDGGSDGPTE